MKLGYEIEEKAFRSKRFLENNFKRNVENVNYLQKYLAKQKGNEKKTNTQHRPNRGKCFGKV